MPSDLPEEKIPGKAVAERSLGPHAPFRVKTSMDHPRITEDVQAELAALRRRVAELEAAEADRCRAEEALRESHEELQAIYNGVVDGLLVADVQTKQFLRCNAAMVRMTGYSEQELLSMSVMDLHPPEDLAYVLERFQAQAEGRLSVNEQCPVLRKDGTVFEADISVGRITYRGRPSMIGFFRDITQRKRAEESLRQSEEKYRILVEASPDAVLMADRQGRITYASQQAVRLYGGERAEELHHRLAIDLVAEEDRPEFQSNLAKLLQGGVQRGVAYTVVRRDGSRIACEVSSAVLRDAAGTPADLVAIVRDISQRKAAEEALRQSHQELQAIYDGPPDGLVIVDIHSLKHVRTNAKMCEMLGYAEEEVPRDPARIHPPETSRAFWRSSMRRPKATCPWPRISRLCARTAASFLPTLPVTRSSTTAARVSSALCGT